MLSDASSRVILSNAKNLSKRLIAEFILSPVEGLRVTVPQRR
jgi:hypothetical protein